MHKTLLSQDALDREPLPPVENNYASVADALTDGKLHRIRSAINQNQQQASTGNSHSSIHLCIPGFGSHLGSFFYL